MMDAKEREAFERSYMGNVAHCSIEELKSFLDDYLNNDTNDENLYNKYDIYPSVMDALGVWSNAISYQDELHKEKIRSAINDIERWKGEAYQTGDEVDVALDKIKDAIGLKCEHDPDWDTVVVTHDGEIYIDVTCKKCGRSGCIGTQKTLESDINWE
jgi:hypothetical protein